jgi:hypothetical protein
MINSSQTRDMFEQNKGRLYVSVFFSTIVNRLCSELNRLVSEIALERDVMVDFQTKLDAAEYVSNKTSIYTLNSSSE